MAPCSLSHFVRLMFEKEQGFLAQFLALAAIWSGRKAALESPAVGRSPGLSPTSSCEKQSEQLSLKVPGAIATINK